MITQIANEKKLKKCISHDISDAGIHISIDEKLGVDEYIGIKVDDYYNGLKLQGNTPKAVDFIVPVDCECDSYALYIMELKNIKNASQITSKEIIEKFDTTIYQFMSEEFQHIFQNDKYKYKAIKLYLVSSGYREAKQYGSYEKYIEILRKTGKKDSLVHDTKLSAKIYRFRNKIVRIEREIPPNPVIKKII